jgi:hypothetical protein
MTISEMVDRLSEILHVLDAKPTKDSDVQTFRDYVQKAYALGRFLETEEEQASAVGYQLPPKPLRSLCLIYNIWDHDSVCIDEWVYDPTTALETLLAAERKYTDTRIHVSQYVEVDGDPKTQNPIRVTERDLRAAIENQQPTAPV